MGKGHEASSNLQLSSHRINDIFELSHEDDLSLYNGRKGYLTKADVILGWTGFIFILMGVAVPRKDREENRERKGKDKKGTGSRCGQKRNPTIKASDRDTGSAGMDS